MKNQRGLSISPLFLFAKRLAERLDASRSNALRLISTESSHIHNTAELDAYNECCFDEYEFMASLGERTCEVCGGMDGKRIKLTDKQFGVNFPPLHPNCRCTTIAFDTDDNLSDFKAGELEYEEWYAKYVEGRELPKLESKGSAEIEVPEKPVPVSPTNEKKTAAQTLTTGGDSGIIKGNDNRTAVDDLHYIGKIDLDIYKCVTKDITTDEVIITDERIQHIKDRHPGVYERFGKYLNEIVSSPDYIIESSKPNSAVILKQIPTENGFTKTAMRLHTSSDEPSRKNSILTFIEIDERDWKRLIKNKKVLYKRE